MNFQLSEEQKALRSTIRAFCQREIIPRATAWNREGHFPGEVIPGLAELGLLGIHLPEAFGGGGQGLVELCIAVEELAAADASVGLTVASHNLLCMDHIHMAGTDAQRARYLPDLARGTKLGAWCLTEPDSGSDAGAARTRAEAFSLVYGDRR